MTTPRTSIAAVQETVARECGVTVADLRGPRRMRRIAHPRQIAMALARELTGASLPEIGRQFGRDHTTVLHGCRNVARLCIEKSSFADKVQFIRTEIPIRGWKAQSEAAMAVGLFLTRMGSL